MSPENPPWETFETKEGAKSSLEPERFHKEKSEIGCPGASSPRSSGQQGKRNATSAITAAGHRGHSLVRQKPARRSQSLSPGDERYTSQSGAAELCEWKTPKKFSRLTTTDWATMVVEKAPPEGQTRVTSGSWGGEKSFSRIRCSRCAHVARKTAAPRQMEPMIELYDAYGPAEGIDLTLHVTPAWLKL